jgi:hypothetical protein
VWGETDANLWQCGCWIPCMGNPGCWWSGSWSVSRLVFAIYWSVARLPWHNSGRSILFQNLRALLRAAIAPSTLDASRRRRLPASHLALLVPLPTRFLSEFGLHKLLSTFSCLPLVRPSTSSPFLSSSCPPPKFLRFHLLSSSLLLCLPPLLDLSQLCCCRLPTVQ